MKNKGITMIPGVEPILLDLENLFLLSVSLENLTFHGKTEKKRNFKTQQSLECPKHSPNTCFGIGILGFSLKEPCHRGGTQDADFYVGKIQCFFDFLPNIFGLNAA